MRFDVAEKLIFQECDHYFGLPVWHLLRNTGIRNQRMAGRAVTVVVDWLHIARAESRESGGTWLEVAPVSSGGAVPYCQGCGIPVGRWQLLQSSCTTP